MTLSSLISGAAWTLCRLLPVKKNKVVFAHFYGKGFGDSPKAIALALRDAAPGADIVWLISDPSVALPEGIRPASYATLSRIYHLSTARVWFAPLRCCVTAAPSRDFSRARKRRGSSNTAPARRRKPTPAESQCQIRHRSAQRAGRPIAADHRAPLPAYPAAPHTVHTVHPAPSNARHSIPKRLPCCHPPAIQHRSAFPPV